MFDSFLSFDNRHGSSLIEWTFDVEFPETVEKAVEHLKQILSKEDIEFIRSMKEKEEVISMHMTLGNWIRNSFGLWSMNGPKDT